MGLRDYIHGPINKNKQIQKKKKGGCMCQNLGLNSFVGQRSKTRLTVFCLGFVLLCPELGIQSFCERRRFSTFLRPLHFLKPRLYDDSLRLSFQTPPSIFPLPLVEQDSDKGKVAISISTHFLGFSVFACFIFVCPDL